MNPLLEKWETVHQTVPFEKINNQYYLPALQEAIKISKKQIQTIIKDAASANFENTILALENAGELVERVATILYNLNSAETNTELQKIAREASALLSEYSNDIILDEQLFGRIKKVYEENISIIQDIESKTLLEKTYKRFTRNGANLSQKDKDTLRDIDKRLSELTLRFGENVLHETNDFSLEITDEQELSGLPEAIIEAARITAEQKGKPGYVFTLQAPSYMPFMMYADKRELRKKMFMAYGSRAFKNNEHNNQALIKEIVQLRQQRAQLLGYTTHAAFVLEERMAASTKRVEEFLEEILSYAKPVAQTQMQELLDYAKKIGFQEDRLERWDYAYYSEKLKKEKFSIDDELLKPYLSLEQCVEGIFEVTKKLYGLNFKENNQISVYHPEVKTYEVFDENQDFIAILYMDLFPRESKQAGAWMTSFREQKEGVRPHVSIVANFSRPTASQPSLLTFNELTTLFHEFGHALHGMLANGKYQSISGTNVYWDFVELPSQIMENWCYEKEALDLFARHYQTNQPIPQDYIDKIKASSNFMEGYATLRQLAFGLLDMAWHGTTLNGQFDIEEIEKQAMLPADLFPAVPGTNSSCAFSHIFAGGYAAGYYSYKWAEVLDADAFEYFREQGIFSKQVAQKFKENVLSRGGSEHPMELYKRFRGQEPSVQPLLKRAGLLV